MKFKQIVKVAICIVVTGPVVIQAQMVMNAKVYVCTAKDGHVTLQNLRSGANCSTRIVPVPIATTVRNTSPNSVALMDPQPVTGAMMVGAQVAPAVQQGRDMARARILVGELARAQEQLSIFQTQSSNSGSARLDGDLKRNLTLAQENVASLKREIARVTGSNADSLVQVLP